jgi:hypothetical protein
MILASLIMVICFGLAIRAGRMARGDLGTPRP